MQGTVTVSVNAPPEVAFAYVADLENAPEWVNDLVSMQKTTDGDVGIGTRYTEVVQMGKQQSEAELEVTEYDPPRLFAHKGKGGPAEFTARFILHPEGSGTRIEHHYTVKMSGIFALFAPLTNRWVRKNTESGMETLKTLLDNAT